MIAVISVDTYPFLVFSDLTCHLKDTGINVFGCTVQSDSKKTKLEVVTKSLLHQQVKIQGQFFHMSCKEVSPYSSVQCRGYFRGP